MCVGPLDAAGADERQDAHAESCRLAIRDGRSQLLIVPALAVDRPHLRVARFDPEADPDQSPLRKPTPGIAIEPWPREIVEERVDAIETRISCSSVGTSARPDAETSWPMVVEVGRNCLDRLVQHIAARQEDETALRIADGPRAPATSRACCANSAVVRTYALRRRRQSERPPRGVTQGRLQDHRVLAFRRQKGQGAVGARVPLAMREPGGGIPSADPFQELAQLVATQRLGLGRSVRLPRSAPASRSAINSSATSSGCWRRGRRPRRMLSVRRCKTRFGPSRTRSIGVNLGVEPLEIMDPLDERPLPSPLEVEVVDRRIAEIQRKGTVLEPGEDRISGGRRPVPDRSAGGTEPPVPASTRPRCDGPSSSSSLSSGRNSISSKLRTSIILRASRDPRPHADRPSRTRGRATLGRPERPGGSRGTGAFAAGHGPPERIVASPESRVDGRGSSRSRSVLLSLAMNLAGNGRTGLWDRDEPRYAVCVREMRARGDWIFPTFNGEPRYHKPILIYWLMGLTTALGRRQSLWRPAGLGDGRRGDGAGRLVAGPADVRARGGRLAALIYARRRRSSSPNRSWRRPTRRWRSGSSAVSPASGCSGKRPSQVAPRRCSGSSSAWPS